MLSSSLTMTLPLEVVIPAALVVGIRVPPRYVQGRVGPAPAEVSMVGPAVAIVARGFHLLELVER